MPSAFSDPSFTLNPTFKVVLSNDIWVSAKVFEVDITLISTDVNPIEYATSTIVLAFNESALNGGTITAAWVSGTTSGFGSLTPALDRSMTDASTGTLLRVIKLNGKIPPGYGNGPLIQTGAGTKIGRLRLTAAAATWLITPPNLLKFCPMSVWPSNVNAYIYDGTYDEDLGQYVGTNVNIWANATLVSTLTDGSLLPVELSSFASAAQGRSVVLNWSTKTEKNSDRFEVERSLVTNGTWSTVGTVKASVLSNSVKNYSYTDTKLQSGKYQYRLKMVDNDGSFAYSSVEATEVAIPKDFAVSQNYPNPFNPSTKIDYQVPVDAKVILEVYNVAGQKVMELVNQQMSAGYYTVDFGASKLSSGVYIYRLAASDLATGNNFSSIKKMILLK
jgi:hypothetical protein